MRYKATAERRSALDGNLVYTLEHRWGRKSVPLPTRTVPLKPSTTPATPDRIGFDFSRAMRELCTDVAARCPELSHIDTSRLLLTYTSSRNRSRYGLQARVTPMRFRDGNLTRRLRGVLYGVQRYYVDGREMLYLVTFCLPRFLDQTFEEKLITIFHELYHISPEFNGDLRRLPGRYEVHSHSAREYDRYMLELLQPYLANHPQPRVFDFLHLKSQELIARYGGVVGTIVPRPKLVPLQW